MTSLLEQLAETEVVLAWDHEQGVVELSVIELVFDPHELRIPKGQEHAGRWVHSPLAGDMPGKPGSVDRYVIPDPHRLDVPEPKKPRKNYYVHPGDHPFFQKHPVSPQHVLDYYGKADAGTREQGRAWYREIHKLAGTYIAPGDPEAGGILLSTYSPQTRWPINMMNAARSHERGYGIGAGEGVMASNDQAEKANKAMAGEGIDKLMTTAKTHSFGVLIKQGDDSPDDPYGHVVIDTHALNIAVGGGVRGDEGGYGDAPIGNARYHEYVADQYRIAAKEISRREGRLMKPHELQAITWLVMQRETQAQDAYDALHPELLPPKERGRAKGRIGGTKKDWRTWLAYAKQHKIPLQVGVSAPPPGMLAAQIAYAEFIDLMGPDSLAIQLAAWEGERRGPDGRWISSGGLGTQLLDRPLDPFYNELPESGSRGTVRSKGTFGAQTGRESDDAAKLAAYRRQHPAGHDVPAGTDLGKVKKIRQWITAAEARGNSRPVSFEEYQHLAAKGNQWVDRMKNLRSPITGLDSRWDQIKANAYAEVRKSWGGATIDAHTGIPLASDADRYAISVKPKGMDTVSVPETATAEEFSAAMDRAKEMFRPALERQSYYLGVFHDDEHNRIDIDPVAVVGTTDLVEQVGSYTRAIGGAYHFKTGNGYWPPHVAEAKTMAGEQDEIHFRGPGEWHSQAVEIQEPEPDDEPDDDGDE